MTNKFLNTYLAVPLSLVMSLLSGCMVWRVPTMRDQERASVLIDQGVTSLRRGEFGAARISFQLARELFESAAAIDGLGCVALLEGDLEKAEMLFNEALEIDFSYTEVYGNLALLREYRGDDSGADALYRKAIELDPGSYRTRNNYAIFLAHRDERDLPSIRTELMKAALLGEASLMNDNLTQLSR